MLFGEQHKHLTATALHSRTSRPHGSVSGHAVDGVQPRSDARAALRSGRGLDAADATPATPTALHVAGPLGSRATPDRLHVEVSQMLYEQREKSIEQRGEFEEELIGSGGTSLEACAPSKLVSELLSEGVGRCDNVLDPQQADALKTFVRDALVKAERDTSKGKIPPKHRFAEVLLKENRRDFLLPLDDEKVLNAARTIALSPIGDAVEEILGEDAVVHECSCLISDHGSPRQVLHPDTPQHETGETPLLTCFTALQDVSEDMGPTLFLPKTQDKVSHLRFFNDVTKDELLKEHPQIAR